MKKMFLAAITALALCSYSYAQDDEDEYEEDDAPARVEQAPAIDEDEEAPAPKPAKVEKKQKKSSDGSAFLHDILQHVFCELLLYRSAILGLYHFGETSTETKAPGSTITVDAGDNHTAIALGAGFDYFLPTPLLPTSAGIDLIYASNGETEVVDEATKTTTTASSGDFMIDLVFGIHAEIVPNMILSGKVGLGIDYVFSSNEVSNQLGSIETSVSRLDFGLKAGVYATWFFM